MARSAAGGSSASAEAVRPEFIAVAHELADAAAAVTNRYFRTPVPVDVKADASPVRAPLCCRGCRWPALVGWAELQEPEQPRLARSVPTHTGPTLPRQPRCLCFSYSSLALAAPALRQVTIADREAEAAMRTLLAERFPAHAIFGEEQGYTPGAGGAGGSSSGDGSYLWVIDPIDGTKSFITGGRGRAGGWAGDQARALLSLCRVPNG